MTEIERLRTAFMVTGASEPEGHLSEQQWENLACGELDRGDYEAALDHILGCSPCTDIHQSLLVLKEHAHTFDSGAPVPSVISKPSRRRWVFPGILAAAAMLLVIVFRPLGPGLNEPGSSTPIDPILRSPQMGQTATPLSPVGRTSMSKVVFSWSPSPIAPVSIVQLIDDDGELVWTSQETESTSIDWPIDVAQSPGRYYWRLLSLGEAGDGEQASDLVAFDLTEPSPSSPP